MPKQMMGLDEICKNGWEDPTTGMTLSRANRRWVISFPDGTVFATGKTRKKLISNMSVKAYSMRALVDKMQRNL